VQATLIYMAIYVTMNVGTFAFILSMERDGRPVTDIASLNQFAKKEPLKALAVLVLMFSLAGVPPMVGFFGKFYVLKAAVDAGMVWLAVRAPWPRSSGPSTTCASSISCISGRSRSRSKAAWRRCNGRCWSPWPR
jgi:hypothetical protein